MSEIVNLYGKILGIRELTFKDFNIKHKLTKMGAFNLIEKVGQDNDKLNKNFYGKNGLIIFYSPDCSSCRNKVEFWSNIAINYMNTFPIYAVNCDNIESHNDYLIPLLKIEHYPKYMKFDKNGVMKDFDVTINLENILYYISNNS